MRWSRCGRCWIEFRTSKRLLEADAEEDFSELRRAETTGRPLGAPEFVDGLEKILGRKIARRAPGRKPTGEDPDQLRLL